MAISLKNVRQFIEDNPYESAAIGAVAAGGVALGGVVIGSAISKKTKKKTRKSSSKKKSTKRTKKKKLTARQRYVRKIKKRPGRQSPYTAGARKDRSRKRIRYTKNGQPYVLMASGKARFIKKTSAKRSRKQKGGRY